MSSPTSSAPSPRRTDLSGARLVGRSPAIRAVRAAIAQCAPSPISVIITGPSGSGKEVVARAIHNASPRRTGPFVAVNCGAIPAELLESELFGHEKGAFTGATTQRKGRIEEASGGTIFLDEIGDMPFHMQVKLLRVIEDRAIQRVGGNGQIAVDIRIISATHRDIHAAIDAERFREDLYYRLAVFPIDLPPLADRPEDVALLVDHFITGMDVANPVTFDSHALRLLEDHGWPGNVRELRNVVERASLLHAGQQVGYDATLALLGPRARAAAARRIALAPAATAEPCPMDQTTPLARELAANADLPSVSRQTPLDMSRVLDQLERQYILDALNMADGVIAEASRLLGMQRTTLIGKMNKHQLSRAA